MVVPGMGETMERSSPTMRLRSVDLPTLGRPMMATCVGRSAWCGIVVGEFVFGVGVFGVDVGGSVDI